MTGKAFEGKLRIFRSDDAARLAEGLFRESFNASFPVPRENSLAIPTPPHAWRQYVAVYRWADGREETVGFCNWILWREVYLGGGMCVQKTFYRRLPRDEFAGIHRRGGIAQMLLEAAFRELDDCIGWFGYCGDKKAMAVDLRAGFQPTRHAKVLVKWRVDVPVTRQQDLIDAVAAVGPF